MEATGERRAVCLSVSPAPPVELQVPAGWLVRDLVVALGYQPHFAVLRHNGRYASEYEELADGSVVELLLVRSQNEYRNPQRVLSVTSIGTGPSQRLSPSLTRDHSAPSRCDRCGSAGVVHTSRARRGATTYEYNLCSECFLTDAEARAVATTYWDDLIQTGDHVLVPISGEKDSAAALYMLTRLRDLRGDFSLTALHISEGIGDYGRQRAEKAQQLADMLGVAFHAASFGEEYGYTLDEIVARVGPRSEACSFCLPLKWRLVHLISDELGASTVAHGDNLDEQLGKLLSSYLLCQWGTVRHLGAVSRDTELGDLVIRPCCWLTEKELALLTFLLPLPVNRHYECECTYAVGELGSRQVVEQTVGELEDMWPGLRHRAMANFAANLGPLLPSRLATPPRLECEKCGVRFPTLVPERLCPSCRVLERHGIAFEPRRNRHREASNVDRSRPQVPGSEDASAELGESSRVVRHPGMRWWKGPSGYLLHDGICTEFRDASPFTIALLEQLTGIPTLEHAAGAVANRLGMATSLALEEALQVAKELGGQRLLRCLPC